MPSANQPFIIQVLLFSPLFLHSPNENYPIINAKTLSTYFHFPSILLPIHSSGKNKSHKRLKTNQKTTPVFSSYPAQPQNE